MLKRLFFVGAAIASISAFIGFVRARALFRRWGVTAAETARTLPGDELIPNAEAIDTRGLDIAAAPETVWPWLVQMGYGRAGWYSYDQLDMNRPSFDRIVPELQALAVGDIVPTHPGGGFEVKAMEPGKSLVLYADRSLVDAQRTAAPEGLDTASGNVKATGAFLSAGMQGGDFHATWAFVLEPTTPGGTRLIERFRGRMELPQAESTTPKVNPAVAGRMLMFGFFVMARRQMLGIRDRAEGRPISRPPFRGVVRPARMGSL